MKLRLLTVGKLSLDYLRVGCDDFAQRIRRALPLEIVELKEDKSGGRRPEVETIRRREGEALLAKIPSGAFVVVLDERGRRYTSMELAGLLERHMVQGTGDLVWIIGGPYGVSETLRQRADLVLSLSAMTMTHQMVRLLLLEQIYRGLTIIRNEPYHNV